MVAPNADPQHRGQTPSLRGWLPLFLIVFCCAVAACSWWGWRRYCNAYLQDLRQTCEQAVEDQDWTRLKAAADIWSKWDPQSADAWLYLGEACSETGENELAVSALRKVPDDSPKSHPALLVATDLQFEALNQPLEAVETLKHLIAIHPRSTTARQRLIYFYAVTLQRTEMIAAIRDAVSKRAEPPEVYVYLVIADHLSFTNGVQEADKWLKSSQDSELFQVARALQLIDRIENSDSPAPETLEKNARLELERLTAKYPGNMAILRYQLEAASVRQDLMAMEALLQSEPPEANQDSVIWRLKAWYRLRTGDVQGADEAIRKSLEIFPMDWRSWNEFSSILRRTGKLDEAEEAARIALEGKELRKVMMGLPSARDLTTDQLQRIGNYAEMAGDGRVARAIRFRIQLQGLQAPGDTVNASTPE